ncbi:MAG: hypothetical protein ABIE22_02545 [archaeon]
MKIYTAKSKIIGPCGPCSFINLTGLKGTAKLEEQLAELGRLKPFHASTYSAFLVWMGKYHADMEVFTESKKLNNKMFELMFYYEKIPKKLQSKYKQQAIKLIEKRNKKYSSKIKLLKRPIKKLDELLNKGYLVAVLMSDY